MEYIGESIYEKTFNYGQVKAICEVFKYKEELENTFSYELDYEDIIAIGLKYYEEWERLADLRNGKRTEPVYNDIGNEINFVSEEEYAYEQAYVDRRVREDYLM